MSSNPQVLAAREQNAVCRRTLDEIRAFIAARGYGPSKRGRPQLLRVLSQFQAQARANAELIARCDAAEDVEMLDVLRERRAIIAEGIRSLEALLRSGAPVVVRDRGEPLARRRVGRRS